MSKNIKDYCKILSVSIDEDIDSIKKKYKKLALKHHPDRPGGDPNKFQKISHAYDEILKYKENPPTKFDTLFSNFHHDMSPHTNSNSIFTQVTTTIHNNQKVTVKTSFINGVKTTQTTTENFAYI